MAKKIFKLKNHLANALDETVSSAKNNEGELHIEIIPIKKLELDPDNPRTLSLGLDDMYNGIQHSDEKYSQKKKEISGLSSMAESISKQGVLNPIIVYSHADKYRLIAGERRVFGSIISNKIDIPAKILSRKPDPLQLSLLQWIENIEREDLSLWDRIRNLKKILVAYCESEPKKINEISATEISQLINCSIQQGVTYKNVITAAPSVNEYIKNNSIKSLEKAALIASSPLHIQEEIIKACLQGATLKQLKETQKKLLTILKKKSNNRKVGRPSEKITFGSTKKPSVAKVIIQAILSSSAYSKLSSSIPDVKWDDHKSITFAFKKLLDLLETEVHEEVI